MKYRRKNRQLSLPEITLTPLIDTALTLLIIFMVTAPMMRLTLKVDLPESKTAQTTKIDEQSLVVEIDAHGMVHVRGKLFDVSRDAGKAALSKSIQSIAEKNWQSETVFLYGDKALTYKKVVDVFDILQATKGVMHVALVTQKAQ